MSLGSWFMYCSLPFNTYVSPGWLYQGSASQPSPVSASHSDALTASLVMGSWWSQCYGTVTWEAIDTDWHNLEVVYRVAGAAWCWHCRYMGPNFQKNLASHFCIVQYLSFMQSFQITTQLAALPLNLNSTKFPAELRESTSDCIWPSCHMHATISVPWGWRTRKWPNSQRRTLNLNVFKHCTKPYSTETL